MRARTARACTPLPQPSPRWTELWAPNPNPNPSPNAAVQAELAEGCLRVRLIGTGEVREIQADSESMSFDEPGVGTNLQKLQLKVRARVVG